MDEEKERLWRRVLTRATLLFLMTERASPRQIFQLGRCLLDLTIKIAPSIQLLHHFHQTKHNRLIKFNSLSQVHFQNNI